MSQSVFSGRRLPVVLVAVVAMLVPIAAMGVEPQTSLIAGNHSPAVEKLVAPQPAPIDQMLTMRIDLNPSHRDELEHLLVAQQDPTSPSYHKWLKTGEFDQRFGPDPESRAAIARWLKEQGFEVSQSPNGRAIKFTGTVAQAQSAFSVAIYSTDGGKNYGNFADPAVPAQFAGSIAFIDGLDNLRGSHTSMHFTPGSPAATNQLAPSAHASRNVQLAENDDAGQPVTISGKTGFGPSDFYTFYDVNPLLNKSITGTGGGCIGLAEISDFPDAAITSFDNTFKLAAATITRVVASDSDNPGLNDREGESTLDIEYSHVFAPGAPIRFYLSDPKTPGSNVILATVDALDTAVSENLCSSISISIESCGFPSSFYTGALHTTYMNAATQGQTVFVAEGDEGAAEFDVDPSTHQCVIGTSRNVNELASDPNITSIGGTQFTPTFKSGNDVGFVPESVWNEGMIHPGIGSGGGGVSVVFSKPSFQQSGTPADGARDVPDISMEAACKTPGAFSVFPDQKSGNNVECCACGTSIGAPIWAGITELMVQSNSNTRVGSINPRLYTLGNQQDTATTGIRDVTKGNNDFNGVTGFQAGTGFDLASGWGTPDVATFVPAYLGLPIPTATPTPDLAAISVPRSVSLPPAGIGVEGGSSKNFVIKNTGKSGTLSGTVVPQDASQFTVSPGSFSMEPRAESTQTVTFVPTASGKQTATLMVSSNAMNEATANVALSGVGEAGKLIAPRSEAFVTPVNTPTTKNIVLKNGGKGVLSIQVGAASPSPTYSSSPSNPTMQPGATATISVTFSPSAKGAAAPGSLPITVSPPSTGPSAITLKGTGK